ncbi:hypothetical protein [Novipirellula artificiosorum]|uniref:Uncharacterized protein n=1 Tax=Novipirellula artificiosorum TaxID=2528016 RepID=A0A5C6DBL0_9BACT|nr:hypothetical protein [Novipirellula artificiosorum]TWU34200.1 hypothetical protein Poly41_43460 [Novipirellula artificiosorum]
MATRLTVVMVQSPPPSSTADFEPTDPAASKNCSSLQSVDRIVGELLGAAGIDLMLIGRPEQIAPDSTDHLSLELIQGDVAILDWQSPSALCEAFAELGLRGARFPHPHDEQTAKPTANRSRRLYAFDLRQFGSPQAIRNAMQELLNEKQVRTFSLIADREGQSTAARERRTEPSQTDRSTPPITVRTSPPQHTTASVLPLRHTNGGPAGGYRETSNEGSKQQPKEARPQQPPDALDALVDQLDHFDLG